MEDTVVAKNGAWEVTLESWPTGDSLMTVDTVDTMVVVSVSPDKARALAALLLKHADRAEGRGT